MSELQRNSDLNKLCLAIGKVKEKAKKLQSDSPDPRLKWALGLLDEVYSLVFEVGHSPKA